MMQQKEGHLKCKVSQFKVSLSIMSSRGTPAISLPFCICCQIIFPLAGDYKLDMFGREERDAATSFSLVCTYIIKVDEAKEAWTAFPKNPR